MLKFNRKYLEDDENKKKMNYYSQDLDYNLIDSNINILRTNKTQFPSLQKNKNDENMNKLLFQDAKNVNKTNLNKDNSR